MFIAPEILSDVEQTIVIISHSVSEVCGHGLNMQYSGESCWKRFMSVGER